MDLEREGGRGGTEDLKRVRMCVVLRACVQTWLVFVDNQQWLVVLFIVNNFLSDAMETSFHPQT